MNSRDRQLARTADAAILPRPIHTVMGKPLLWERSGWFRPTYTLRCYDDVLAIVRSSGFRSADITVAEGRYRFVGAMGPRHRVRVLNGDTQIANAALSFLSGSITFDDGRSFRLRAGWPFRFPLALFDAGSGALILTNSRRPFRWRETGVCEIEHAAWGRPDLALLAALDWFMLVQRQRRAAHSGGG